MSSPSERSFSTTRRIEKGDRNRLSEKSTEMLSFININTRPKTPKVPILWKDIHKALYTSNRSLLQDDQAFIMEISNGDNNEESEISQQTTTETVDDDLQPNDPRITPLQGSPDSLQVDSPICLSSSHLSVVSPLIEMSSNPISFPFFGDSLNVSDSEEEITQ